MATSKKDYIAIARILAAQSERFVETGIASTPAQTARNLADYFTTQNSQFDRARFLQACGVSSCK